MLPHENKTVQDEELAKVLTARSEPGIIHADKSQEIISACEDLSWNHDESTDTDQTPKELLRTQSVE